MAYDTTLHETLAPPGATTPARPGAASGVIPATGITTLWWVGALSALFLLGSIYPLHHTDLWGHLSFGRHIAEHGTLPASDPFTAAATSKPVVHVSWLAQLSGYLVWKSLGEEGLLLLHSLLLTGCFAGVMLAATLRGVPAALAIGCGATAFVLSLPVAGVLRPQLFGMAALPLVLIGCCRLPKRRDPLLWLPPLFAVWTNMHGSFVVGLGVLGICSLDWVARIIGKHGGLRAALGDPRFARALLAPTLAVVAAGLNPAGLSLYFTVLKFGGHEALTRISEWRPLTINTLSGGLFFASLLLTVVLVRRSPRRFELKETLLLMIFAAAALLSMRMLLWWALVWPWVVAPHLNALLATQVAANRRNRPQRKNPTRTLIAVSFIFAALVLSPSTNALLTGRQRGIAQTASPATPIALGAAVEERQVAGRVLAPMDWGDWLIWKSGGRLQPFVYSHVHLSTAQVWRDYLYLMSGPADWAEVADRHDIELVALDYRSHGQLIRRLLRSPRAVVLYRDHQAVLFRLRP